MPFLVDVLIGTAIIGCVSLGCCYHLGRKHGWSRGFAEGLGNSPAGQSRVKQPLVHSILHVPYVLGWHHGWDFGFREGDRERTAMRSMNHGPDH
jgi:hypothetical protein